MGPSDAVRTAEDVHVHVGAVCFKTGPPGAVGAELEWLVADPRHPTRPVPLPRTVAAVESAGPFPGGSAFTLEPGGQVELSSPVAPGDPATPGLDGCWRTLDLDAAHLRAALRGAGLDVLGAAADPSRGPLRQVHAPRYDAMAEYFAARGGMGASMMCSTAAVQVCLDAGADEADVRRRWRLLHTLGPVLVAAFANSPYLAGRATGWRSSRQLVWATLDRGAPCGAAADPATAWAEHALAAPVMTIRSAAGRWRADPGLTFAQWVAAGAAGRVPPPTVDDLDYHLSTLFPPVRPRGYLEVRYLDAQPLGWWPVPVAVVVALVEDAVAGEAALSAAAPLYSDGADPWRTAALRATSDPATALAARRCLHAALEALPRLGTSAALVDLVAAYADRWTDRGRCPADDALDARSRNAALETVPPTEEQR